MKRFFGLLLTAALLIGCLSMAVFATGSVTVTVSDVQAKAGQEVAVTFTVSEAAFANYGMTITYDTSAMTLTEVRAGTGYSGLFVANTDNGVIGYANSNDQTVSGELFTAVFLVAADAPAGTYPVGLDVEFIADAALEDLAVSVEPGSVTVGDIDAEPVPPPPSEEMTFAPPETEASEPAQPEPTEPAEGEADDPVRETQTDGTPGNAGGTAESGGNTPLYIAAAIMAVALIVIVAVLISKRRTAK